MEKKSGTLAGLFILHAHTPIQDICNANSAQESELCLLGSLLCVYVCESVGGCTLSRYLSTFLDIQASYIQQIFVRG